VSVTTVASAAATPARANGRQVWSLLWNTSRPLALLVVGWALVSALISPAVVAVLGAVVGHVPGAVEYGMESGPGHALILWLVIAALTYAASLIVGPIGAALGTACNARITGEIQARLLRAVSAPAGVDHLEDSDVLDRLSRAEGSLTGFFPGNAPVTWLGLLSGRLAGIVGCAIVAYYVWWLGLLLLVMWLSVRRWMLGAVVRQSTDLRAQSTVMRRAWYFIGVGSKVRDAKEIRVFGLGDFVASRFGDSYRESIRGTTAGLRGVHVRALLCWLVVIASYALTLTVIAVQARDGSIDLRVLATLLPMLSVTMGTGSVTFDDIQLAWTLTSLPDVDSLESDLVGAGSALAGSRAGDGLPRRSVRFEGVHFAYPAGTSEVLRGVDLELPVGTSTAIVGINGAGKSTLVSLLSRLRDPTAGRITVDGVDIADLEPVSWQRRVAIMPQDPVRYPLSAYANVALGAIESMDDRAGVEECARRAGFDEVLAHLPHGWETVLSRELPDGAGLSGGQWQRLALARALFATRHGARLLVLDEPTAALDVRGEAQFYRRFLQITGGLTTVVISHRFATVRRADRIAVLDGGCITEVGTHDELVALGGTYADAYRIQAARFGAAS
jgi:ATP-binding cassette subfamily B protein